MKRGRRLIPIVAVFAAAVLATPPASFAQAPAPGAKPADKWPDFNVRPPAPFSVNPSSHPQNDKVFAIRSWSGFPRTANRDGNLCSVAFKAAAQNSSLTQAVINEQVKSGDWRSMARGALANLFNIDAETVYEDNGIAGLELIVTPKLGPDAASVRLVMAIAETPKGRATMSCAVPASDLDDALPQLRTIRQTIQIPQ